MPKTLRPLIHLAAAALLASVALVGCGSSDKAGAGGCRSAEDAAEATKPDTDPGRAVTEVEVEDPIKGCGAAAKAGDCVSLNYVGVSVKNDREFDESYSSGQPLSFVVGSGGVIGGFDKAADGLRLGGRRIVHIPPAEGYGSAPPSPDIAPNDTLVFTVDLLAVDPAGFDAAPCAQTGF